MKYKTLLILILIFLSFSNNIANAIQDIDAKNNKYPDYSYIFTGKDRCEGFNRKLFMFNLKLNNYVLCPINKVWASILPKYGMDRLQNAYNNMNFPVRLVSCALQKDFKSSRLEFVRFITNTTIGVGGFYDPAKKLFKLESKQEDMGQVLAHYNMKLGPYLVLPVVRGNIRDLVGQLLDYPLRPLSYIPIAGGIANAVFAINNTTYAQPLIKKVDESYADPYEVAKQIHGITRYIKNQNLDREEIFREKTASQNLIKINNTPVCDCNLKCDCALNNYNPQTPLVDSLRTVLFQEQNPKKSIWSTMSFWNRTFEKKIKIASVNIDPKQPNYKYRYILQKSKTSPLAIIYPSIGEGINSDHSNVLTKILYEEGYSVVIMGSAFQWEFVKSMPEGYKPGLPDNDAKYLRQVAFKIIESIEKKKEKDFSKRIIVGTSFGAMTALFTAAQEEENNTLNVSRYISINPPIELFYALKLLDKNNMDWQNDTSDLKMRVGITAEKIVQVSNNITDDSIMSKSETMPFTDDEAKLVIGFIMKQKLSDVIFAVEGNTRCKKCKIYEIINKTGFYDYGQKYLFVDENKTSQQYDYETSLHIISDFLQKNDTYKIYHTLDDYYVNPQQLVWLKGVSKNKTILFNNGSHLGYLYRKEFLDQFKNDIKLVNDTNSKSEIKPHGL